jgi:hypothetical protein
MSPIQSIFIFMPIQNQGWRRAAQQDIYPPVRGLTAYGRSKINKSFICWTFYSQSGEGSISKACYGTRAVIMQIDSSLSRGGVLSAMLYLLHHFHYFYAF